MDRRDAGIDEDGPGSAAEWQKTDVYGKTGPQMSPERR